MTQRQRWTRILSGVVGFGTVMDAFGAVVGTRAIERSFHASPWAMRWVLSVYLLPLALLLPMGTRFGDRFGHRRTLVVGLAGFAVAAAGCAWAPNVGVLITARVVAGAGAAAAFSGAFGLADATDAESTDGESADSGSKGGSPGGGSADSQAAGSVGGAQGGTRTAAGPIVTRETGGHGGRLGVATAVPMVARAAGAGGRRLGVILGVVLGPALAALTDQGLGWRWYYGAQAAVGGLLVVVARLYLPERRGRRHALDLEGCAVAAVAVVGFIWALNRSVEIGWDTVEVIGALALGGVAFGFLVVWQMPTGSLHRRRFLSANLTEFLFAASIFGPAYPAARDLQWVRAIGPVGTGLGLTAWAAVAAWPLTLRSVTGRRMLPRRCRPAGLLLHCAGLAVLASTVRAGHPAVEVAALAVSALGSGLALGADQALPGAPVPPAVGLVSLVGAVAGIAVLAVTVPGLGSSTAGSYHRELASALRVATVLAAAASSASLVAPSVPGATPGAGGALGRLCCRLALLPTRGITACGDSSHSGGHPPGNCLSTVLTVW